MAMTLRRSLMMGLIAEESIKTRRARQKLRRRLALLEKKVTTNALDQKKEEIARRIERYPNRVVVENKTFSLFDKNQNPAKVSRVVAKFADQIASEIRNTAPTSKEFAKKHVVEQKKS